MDFLDEIQIPDLSLLHTIFYIFMDPELTIKFVHNSFREVFWKLERDNNSGPQVGNIAIQAGATTCPWTPVKHQ